MKTTVGSARNAWQLGWVAALILFSAAPVRAIDSASLRLLLLGAQDNNTPQTVMRADIAIALETYKGPRSTEAVAFFLPGKDARWYLQLKDPALAALVQGTDRKVMQRTAAGVKTTGLGEPIADTGISYEDLSRFVVDEFKLWQIADENNDVVLAGGHPQVESAYVYRAYTFDKSRNLPLKVQFYAKTLNNLVKLRTDADHVLIGKKWFPATITVQNFLDNSTATLTVHWSQAASAPPEIFEPASFPASSPVPYASPGAPAAKATP
jgi:hypothetical protein